MAQKIAEKLEMPGKEEKKRRREIVKSIWAYGHYQAEARRPIEKRVLRELLDHLELRTFVQLEDGQIAAQCDHTLTRRFARARARRQ